MAKRPKRFEVSLALRVRKTDATRLRRAARKAGEAIGETTRRLVLTALTAEEGAADG